MLTTERQASRSRRTGERRVVTHIQPLSAARVAFALGLTMSAILLVGMFALYLLGLASGSLSSLESAIVTLGIGGSGDYRLNFFKMLPGFIFLSALWSGFLAGTAAVGAVLYNLLAEIIGGVEIVIHDR